MQDIMRQDTGVDGDAQRLSQLGWMLLLKIVDDREKQYEIDKPDYRSPIPDELCWRPWAANPEGITGEGVKTRIKRELLDTCSVHTIVRLPNGVFNPYTGIRTNLIYFEKGRPTETERLAGELRDTLASYLSGAPE